MRKNLRSAKGIVMGALFLLGGGAASLVYMAIKALGDRLREGREVPEEQLRALREEVWKGVWNADVGAYLSHSPLIFIALFKATLWFIPFLTLMIGFEQIAGDLQHRTIRYTAIRARRSSLVAGKALAIWAVVAILLLALHLFVWLVTLLRGDATLMETLSWGPRMWAFSAVFTAAYAGMTILASSLTRRPILSLFIGMIMFSSLWVLDVSVDVVHALDNEKYRWFEYVGFAIPDWYEVWLVSPKPAEVVGAIVNLLAFGVGTTALASYIVNRRDV
jgi:hypothetical protein